MDFFFQINLMLNKPIKMAPVISQNVAKKHADRIVNTPDPTLVPNELATSFAPIPKANTNAIMKPTIIIHNKSFEYGSHIFALIILFSIF